jgi:hypothetical protein
MSESVPTKKLITFWSDKLELEHVFMSSALRILIKSTIDDLKALEELREEGAQP